MNINVTVYRPQFASMPGGLDYIFKLMRTWLRNAKLSDWWQLIKRARERWEEVDGDQRAAAFAYYLLLSLFPLLILLVTGGSLFVEREVATRKVVQLVNHYSPLWAPVRIVVQPNSQTSYQPDADSKRKTYYVKQS